MRNHIAVFPSIRRRGEMQADEMIEALGFPPKSKLPPHGVPATKVSGVWVYIRPLGDPLPNGRRRFSLRVRAVCPYCQRDVAASRLVQHIVTHPDELARDNAATAEDYYRD